MDNSDANSSDDLNPGSSHLSMVEWYAPDQLLKTVKEVFVSSLFSHHADRRAFYTEWQNPDLKPFSLALVNREIPNKLVNIDLKQHIVDVNSPDDEIWVDYVADTGDGGNSTYTVASLLLNDLNVQYDESKHLGIDKSEFDAIKRAHKDSIPRADLLILGGDLVYPVASEENYRKFFINHFKSALSQKNRKNLPLTDRSKVNGVVFAFPQNHDWYDSLASFSTIFCHKEKDTFLDMFCPQEQSYAAIKLPHDWWIFGLDFGLTDDIDDLQFEYFIKIIEGRGGNGEKLGGLNANSRVILQYPTPYWALAASGVPKSLTSYRYEDLEKHIEKATGKDISIRLAGDQHHYQRFTTEKNDCHLITSGTGGAFLHPTHGPASLNTLYHQRDLTGAIPGRNFIHHCDEKTADCRKFSTCDQQKFPPPNVSFKLSLGNLNEFFLRNIMFGLFSLLNTDIRLLYGQIKEQKGFLKKLEFLGQQYKLRFGMLTATTYFLIVWLNFVCLHTDLKLANINSIFFENNGEPVLIAKLRFEDIFQAFELWCWAFLMSPLNALLILTMVFNFGTFAQKFNPHASSLSFCLGILHGLAHFFMIFICYWTVLYVIDWPEHIDPVNGQVKLSWFIVTGLCIAFMGDIVGTFTMAWYLYLTLNLHRWVKNIPLLHFNEAFSSLSVQDYKGILRMRITKDKLEAFLIGVERIPRKWQASDKDDLTKPAYTSVDYTIKPELVDYWSVINKK